MDIDPNPIKITVLIPVRNGADFIEQAVNSVLAQRVEGLRLVVSDNGSTDQTPDILRKYAGRSDVHVVRQTDSLSMLEHFNKCLALVESGYYMLLCHDDYLLDQDALARALEVLTAQPRTSAVYCHLKYVDTAGRHIAIRKFPVNAEGDADGIAIRSIRSMRNQFGIPLLVRTSARGNHLYNPALPYVADLEMSCHLSLNGSTHHLQHALIANRYHSNNSTKTLHGDTMLQMEKLARLYGIPLGLATRLHMHLSSWLVRAGKFLFFKYVDLRRMYFRA